MSPAPGSSISTLTTVPPNSFDNSIIHLRTGHLDLHTISRSYALILFVASFLLYALVSSVQHSCQGVFAPPARRVLIPLFRLLLSLLRAAMISLHRLVGLSVLRTDLVTLLRPVAVQVERSCMYCKSLRLPFAFQLSCKHRKMFSNATVAPPRRNVLILVCTSFAL